MGIIIDTSVLIDLERRDEALETLLSTLGDEDVAIAAIIVSELIVGIHRAEHASRRARREAFVSTVLEQIPVLPFDVIVARAHAGLWAQLAGTGQMIGANDLFIAATALAHGYSVMTENIREFSRVPGLVVRQPEW